MLSGKQTQTRELTPSHEHYLRAIWEVHSQHGYARLTDVARELEVAPPTLSVGLRALEARGLVSHDRNRFLVLTPSGERAAREVHHRFAVMRSFLHDVLGVAAPEAVLEADHLEHAVSGPTTERLLDLLKLLREDDQLREFLERRFAHYRRSCAATAGDCSTCDLACLTRVPA